MTKSKLFRSAEVDTSIRVQPPRTLQARESLGSCFHQVAPGAVELTNYNIPAFAAPGRCAR